MCARWCASAGGDSEYHRAKTHKSTNNFVAPDTNIQAILVTFKGICIFFISPHGRLDNAKTCRALDSSIFSCMFTASGRKRRGFQLPAEKLMIPVVHLHEFGRKTSKTL